MVCVETQRRRRRIASGWLAALRGVGPQGMRVLGKPAVRGLVLGTLLLSLIAAASAEEVPRLVIEGGTESQRENIRAFVSMARYPCALPPVRERGVIRDVETRVTRALRALGHYRPEVEFAIDRSAEPCWDLQLTLDPGPVVRIAEVDVRVSGEGADDPFFVAITSDPGIEPGDRLRHDAHDRLRSRLLRVASDRGYLEAEWVTSRLQVDPEADQARVLLHLDSGPRYRFGAITLDQDILRPDFVERLIPFEAGAPYSSSQLLSLQRNLRDSGYFETVRVRPRLDDATDGVVPIVTELEPRKRTAYEVRLGYSTDIGPRVGLAMNRRYANRRGHRFNLDLELAAPRSSLGFNYVIPLADPLRDTFEIFSTYREEDIRDTESKRFQAGVSHVQRRATGWQTTSSLRYEYEDFTVGGVSDTTSSLIPSYRISRTETDDPMHPRDGWRLDLLAQGASEDLGSSISFAQVRGNGKYIRGLGSGRLLLRGDAGATSVSGGVETLPRSLRFFAGGDASVRGFGFQRLGPRDDEDRVIGGRHLLVGSVEYEHPVGAGPWAAAVFVDGGNAFDRYDDYDPQYGFGIGARWRSPVGPIRLDLAHAPDSDDTVRIHFTMGPDL